MGYTEGKISPDSYIVEHHAFIATVMVLMFNPNLKNEVKEHCKTGLNIVGFIIDSPEGKAKANLMSGKEFDRFFKAFPAVYFNNRELLPTDMIFGNIEKCLKGNKVAKITKL
ncbi:hypothetical protein Q4Q35_10785 [Flavivirga aquimarina]|uniref:Uncharacterized protein n=1 Tax=Flavivirga aquimarina TaxID=2027862 RepID=A0ABT8WB08_9FLAO|nr:hypothetical protein [Flavivirga aquimarina]MDO5970291.1 hypothetical protein [Flavivirga aquimarina]